MNRWLSHARKFLAMPPRYMLLRVGAELTARTARCKPGEYEQRLDEPAFLRLMRANSFAQLEQRILSQRMPWATVVSAQLIREHAPEELQRVMRGAAAASAACVNLLGSGAIGIRDERSGRIDWFKDQKSQLSWPFAYFHDIDSLDRSRNSDVKFPWELSRLQWLIPVAQSWQLTGDERYAIHAREVIEDWIASNPCAWGVNWACTMEPAMRVITWCWIYGALAQSPAWQDPSFRFRFLRALYLHLLFVRRFIEVTDVNGNHLTADAAALVVGGTFFGGGLTENWKSTGWAILTREIDRQVYRDGVDFEGSTAYHRLVAELFHIAADAVSRAGTAIPSGYRDQLLRMADYVEAYTRPDGLAPIVGDNDDARALPLGGQQLRDHRYLPSLIRRRWAPETLTDNWRENAAECLWWWGELPSRVLAPSKPSSRLFAHGGICVLRSPSDYVFFCCSPLGLAGRGGHSHNDVLAFEAVLDGCSLVVDPGCLVYTADYAARNRFRSTGVHSTPQVLTEEINRFVSPQDLWLLHHDASARILEWRDSEHSSRVRGSHDGYRRLMPATAVIRTLTLDKANHALIWSDELEPDSGQALRVPLQLDPQVTVDISAPNEVKLSCGERQFRLSWTASNAWTLDVEAGLFAPGYGIAIRAPRLIWARAVNGVGGLTVDLRPLENAVN